MSKIYTSPLCSCIICKKEFHSRTLHTHIQRIHYKSQTNYKNKTKNATIAAANKAKTKRIHDELEYYKNPKYCIQCNNQHSFNKRNNVCCSKSCSASYSNNKKDYSKIKLGPPKGTKPSNFAPFTRVKQCIICSKYHKGSGKSCSKNCLSKVLSIAMNKRIDNGFNPNQNRCRSKPSFLESSFEAWLLKNNKLNYIKNKTFRCNNKIYYGDFYFPDLNILIELDGTQHLNTKEYDYIRDTNILFHHNVYTFRISYTEFISKSKLDIIKLMVL